MAIIAPSGLLKINSRQMIEQGRIKMIFLISVPLLTEAIRKVRVQSSSINNMQGTS
jgi:hypothetical protein